MKNLKLNALESQSLNNKEMNSLRGGRSCGCGCCGSSSTNSNMNANYEGGANGLWSKNCRPQEVKIDQAEKEELERLM
jgi:natural product precursor